ncbi:HlyD family secretion protein [Calothrix sp. NIES-4101]|nr:HlyD family secretion protein [Calothrix sp. NIES-4101]
MSLPVTYISVEDSGINLKDLSNYSDLVPGAMNIQGGNIVTPVVMPSRPVNNSVATVNTNNLSASLQAMLNQAPSSVAYLLLLSSILFLVMVITWVWNGSIEEVNQIRAKLVPIDSKKVQQTEVMPQTLEITEAQLKHSYSHPHYSQLTQTIDFQNQHLTEIHNKLDRIKALMLQTNLADAINTPQSLTQVKSAFTFTALETDKTWQNFLPKVTQNRLIHLQLQQKIRQEIQQEIHQLAKDITQLQIQLTQTRTTISTIHNQIKHNLTNTQCPISNTQCPIPNHQ